jgi:hypothetical protein
MHRTEPADLISVVAGGLKHLKATGHLRYIISA